MLARKLLLFGLTLSLDNLLFFSFWVTELESLPTTFEVVGGFESLFEEIFAVRSEYVNFVGVI